MLPCHMLLQEETIMMGWPHLPVKVEVVLINSPRLVPNHDLLESPRQHQVPILNRVEVEIEKYKAKLIQEEDVSLWRNEKGKYNRRFSTRETWLSIRENYQVCYLHQAVWLKYATPKFFFIIWIAMHGRLSIIDRMSCWNENVNASCVLCQEP